MPSDLVGKLGVRLDFASRGLTGLMGIQVDPYYGSDQPEERLYIKVANFGDETVDVKPGEAVFNIEFAEAKGAAKPDPPKRPTWNRLIENLVNQDHSDWTYVARIQTDLNKRSDALEDRVSRDMNQVRGEQQRELTGIRDNQQSVVMFGVFLVAITILGVSIGVILNVKNAPSWIVDWGWIFLLCLCTVAAIGIFAFMIIAGWGFLLSAKTYAKNSGKLTMARDSPPPLI